MRPVVQQPPALVDILDPDDFALLEPRFLQNLFRPSVFGITDLELIEFLSSCSPSVQRYLRENVAAGVLPEQPYSNSSATIKKSRSNGATKVVAEYAWQLIYRKYPMSYHRFSMCQRIRLDAVFSGFDFKGKAVVDIGAGTGRLIDYLLTDCGSITAIDCAEPMLKFLSERYKSYQNIDFRWGTFQNLPIRDSSIDVIVSCFAFPSTEVGGGQCALIEMRRVLKSNGTAVLIVASKCAQEFLVKNGFQERCVPEAIHYVYQAGDDAIATALTRMAEQQHWNSDPIEKNEGGLYRATLGKDGARSNPKNAGADGIMSQSSLRSARYSLRYYVRDNEVGNREGIEGVR